MPTKIGTIMYMLQMANVRLLFCIFKFFKCGCLSIFLLIIIPKAILKTNAAMANIIISLIILQSHNARYFNSCVIFYFRFWFGFEGTSQRLVFALLGWLGLLFLMILRCGVCQVRFFLLLATAGPFVGFFGKRLRTFG